MRGELAASFPQLAPEPELDESRIQTLNFDFQFPSRPLSHVSTTTKGLQAVHFLPSQVSALVIVAGQRVPVAGIHLTAHSPRRTRCGKNSFYSG